MSNAKKQETNPQHPPGYLYPQELNLPKTFIETLKECHGLLPLGTGGEGCPLFFDPANLREALFNHARGAVVRPERAPISLSQVEAHRKERITAKKKSKP